VRSHSCLILHAGLRERLAPYSPLLAPPLLRCMADPAPAVRAAAAACFGDVVGLLPLAAGPNAARPAGLSAEQAAAAEADAAFLEQLLDNKRAAAYRLPCALAVTPRRYQQVCCRHDSTSCYTQVLYMLSCCTRNLVTAS
jgi:hypothetical protein